jgi:hypothetical protein
VFNNEKSFKIFLAWMDIHSMENASKILRKMNIILYTIYI